MSTFAVCFNRICEMDFLPKDPAILVSSVRSSSARLLPKGRKNMVTFFVYGIDKWKAKKFKYGVPVIIIIQLALICYLFEQ